MAVLRGVEGIFYGMKAICLLTAWARAKEAWWVIILTVKTSKLTAWARAKHSGNYFNC
jgi:hypothetical protein